VSDVDDEEPVSLWIAQLKEGDESAARQLWNRFVSRLRRVARGRLPAQRAAIADDEDAALSALATVFRRAGEGEFPEVSDRHELLRLLVTVTRRKASNAIRDENREKRGGGRVRHTSALIGPDDSNPDQGRRDPAAEELTPEFIALMAEFVERLSGDLQSIAILKLEGYTNQEIASNTGQSLPTVERRTAMIRRKWREDAQ
jgi:RNA polymerase sigma factor (sigma-70 family)